MKITKVKISNLKSHPENPNTHPDNQLKELQNSLDQFEQIKNIVVWQGKVIAGNGLMEAARLQNRTEIEVQDVSDWPEEKAISFMIADNRLQELAIMDNDILSGLITNFDEPLNIPGIDEDILSSLNIEYDAVPDDAEDKSSEVAAKKFGDERDNMTIGELLQSVDLVRISFSGGKDSAGMAIYIHEHFKIPKKKMLLEHFYNPFEWDDMPDYCKYFSETFGVDIIEYGSEPPDEEKEKKEIYGKRNADKFMIETIKRVGLPSPFSKWCFERYKQRVFGHVARKNKNTNYIQAIGMRAAESPRRAKMMDKGIVRGVQPYVYPIFNLSDQETFGLSIKHGIKLHHAYRFFGRTGCPFCPMASHRDFKILKEEYPKVWDKMMELYLLSLECESYRTSRNNRPKDDLAHILGTRSDSARKEKWIPPEGLTFWGE